MSIAIVNDVVADDYNNMTTTALDVSSIAMANDKAMAMALDMASVMMVDGDVMTTVLDTSFTAMADSDMIATTLDTSFATMVCERKEWVCNRWKTNL